MSAPQKWFDIQSVGIASLLTKSLRLPLHQREYSWEESHVKDLFSDVADAIASRPSYFLGTIVITTEDENAPGMVVDGQQRLATTTIFLAAIRDYYLIAKKENLARSIERLLLTNDAETGDEIPSLRLNHDDQEYFRNAIIMRPEARVAWTGKRLKSHERIDKAAELAKQRVDSIVASSNEPLARLLDWRRYLENKAMVLAIFPLSNIDAFRVFETLNDRGLRTSQVDMLKSYLFEQCGDNESTAQVKWSSMRGALESCADDDLMLLYMRHITLAMYGPRSTKEAPRSREHGDFYARIKKDVSGPVQSVKFLETLAKCADDYVAIITPYHAKWNDYRCRWGSGYDDEISSPGLWRRGNRSICAN